MDAATSVPNLSPPGLWESIREALRGSHRDFTTGNLNRAIVLLAIPMVLEMVLESLFAVVDIFWVGRLGPDAIATVGLTESMLTLIIAVGLGLGMATTAMVARRIGEKDPEGAAVGAMQGILLSLAISVVIAIPCTMFAPQLLRIAGGTPAIVAIGSGYTRIALGGGGVLLLLFLNNAIFRGAGDAAVAMRLLWVSNIINLVLDPCLIFGLGPFPRMGVTGAAAATFTGRSIGVLYQFYRLARGTERMRIGVRQMRLNLSVMLRLIRVSHGHSAVRDRAGELDRTGAHRERFRRGGARRLHGGNPNHHFHPAALVGAEQRCSDAGGAEPGRGPARSRGELGVADGRVEHDLPGLDGSGVLPVRAADCELSSPMIRQWRTLRPIAAHLQLRQRRVRVRHGDDAGLQRSGRYDYADDRESLWFLDSGNSACLLVGYSHEPALERSVLLNRDRGVLNCGSGHSAVSARTLEAAKDLIQRQTNLAKYSQIG